MRMNIQMFAKDGFIPSIDYVGFSGYTIVYFLDEKQIEVESSAVGDDNDVTTNAINNEDGSVTLEILFDGEVVEECTYDYGKPISSVTAEIDYQNGNIYVEAISEEEENSDEPSLLLYYDSYGLKIGKLENCFLARNENGTPYVTPNEDGSYPITQNQKIYVIFNEGYGLNTFSAVTEKGTSISPTVVSTTQINGASYIKSLYFLPLIEAGDSGGSALYAITLNVTSNNTTSTKLSKLRETKAAIKQALIDKGQSPTDVFSSYAQNILDIKTEENEIIDVSELPTSNIDFSKYYRVDGRIYKADMVGEWLLNETLNYGENNFSDYNEWNGISYSHWNDIGSFDVDSVGYISLNSNHLVIQDYADSFIMHINYYYVNNDSILSNKNELDYSLSGNYIAATDGFVGMTSFNKNLADGINLRTFYFNEGFSAPQEFINWFTQNATKTSDLWQEYIIPQGTTTISSNGTHDVSSYKNALVEIPSDNDILYVDSLPTENIDDSKYYKVNGKDGLYYLGEEYLLNESLTYVENDWTNETFKEIYFNEASLQKSGDIIITEVYPASFFNLTEDCFRIYGTYFYRNNYDDYSLSGSHIFIYDDIYNDVVDKSSETGIKLRTLTIKKGFTAPETFVDWLKNNSVKQTKTTWFKYITPWDTTYIDSNGEYDVTQYEKANVNVPSEISDYLLSYRNTYYKLAYKNNYYYQARTTNCIGIWFFGGLSYLPGKLSSTSTYNIDFISNGNSYTTIKINHAKAVEYYMYYGNTLVYSHPNAITSNWADDNYKTINITGGEDVENEDLLDFLFASASNSTNYMKLIPLYYGEKFAINEEEIPDGYIIPTLQEKIVEIVSNGTQEITQDTNYDGLSKVTITTNVEPTLETKTITENGTYTPSTDYDGLGKVVVNVQPTGTKEISITSPLEVTEDVSSYASVKISPSIQEKTINITQNGSTSVGRDNGYAGMDTVYVNVNVSTSPTPAEISTVSELEALAVEENIGKVYKYTGETSEDYVNGDFYVVEEGE